MIALKTPIALVMLSVAPQLPLGEPLAARVAPLGEEAFGNKPVPANEQWAPGVLAVANDPHRVYRRWVNGNEEFFFTGDTQAVHAALVRFARIEADVREVILMPGAGATRSFEDKDVAFSWRLYAPSGICLAMARQRATPVYTPYATLTVHIAGAIELAQLSIPKGVLLLGHEDLIQRYQTAYPGKDEFTRGTTAHALKQLKSLVRPGDEAARHRRGALRAFIDGARGVDIELDFDDRERTLSASIVNRRETPVTLVLPGDGSEPGMRTPSIWWTLRDAATDEERRLGWIGCGTIDPMREDEIVTLAPGDRVATTVRRRLPLPGSYRIVLHYDNDPRRGLPQGQVAPDILARVRASERLVLSSRPLEVTVR